MRSKLGAKKATVTKIQAMLLALLVVLSFLITPVEPANAASSTAIPDFVAQFGTPGSDNGQFNRPTGVASDSYGNIYVVDSDNNRIQKFDSSNNYLTQWGSYGTGNGQFSGPYGITTDSSGNIYVSDTNNNRIQKFDSSGNYLTQWGSVSSTCATTYVPDIPADNGKFCVPYAITTDSSGNIYVADSGNNRIQKFDTSGSYLGQWGSASSTCATTQVPDTPADDGKFCFPQGLAIDLSGNIYVADSGNNRIQKLDSNGNYLTQWGSYGGGDGQFYTPSGITTDSNGYIYVVSTNYNRNIQKFDNNGTYLSQWNGSSTSYGSFVAPWGITIDSSGKIYVVDQYNAFVAKYAYPVTSTTFPNSPTGGAPANVTLTTPDGTNITCADTSAYSSLGTQDTGKTYPLGLVNFCMTVPSGSTNLITLTFITDLTPSLVTARKYNSTTHTYADVPGATITETTVSGQHALVLTYNITDNGPLDLNPALGAVTDPVGLATVVSSPGSLAPTGSDTHLAYLVASLLILMSGGVLVVGMHKLRKLH